MILTKIARICTYISLAAPLIAARSLFFPFITGKILFFRTFTEIAIAALALAAIYGEVSPTTLKNAVKKPIFIAFGTFTALFTLSALTAQVPSLAFWSNFERGEGAWQIIHYLLFFFLITVLFQSKDNWKRLVGAQAIIGGFVGLYAIGQALNWPLWIIDPPTGQLAGSLGNPAYMGVYLLFSACFAVWVGMQSTTKAKYFWFILAIFQVVMFFVAQNRGSFAGVAAGGMAALLIWLFQKKRGVRVYIATIVPILLVVVGMATLVLTAKGGNALTDIQPRFWTWESTLAGVIERPLMGWGAENFPFIFDKYYNPKHYLITSWFDRAHSTPLEYLTIGGIPLFLAYFAIFALLLRKIKSPFFGGVLVAYAVSCLVLFETIPLYLVFILIVGLIDAHTNDFTTQGAVKPTRANHNKALMSVMAGTIVIATSISLYATIYRPLRKNMLMLETMRTNGKTDMDAFQEHEDVLSYWSPVGAQEDLQGLMTFTISYFDYLRQNKLTGQVSKEKVKEIMALNARWYDRIGPSAPGLKIMYIRITGLLAAYQQTKDIVYLKEADRLIATGTAASPTRIEFVRFRMASAALQGDRGAYTEAYKKGKVLLPNYDWVPDIAKFVY